VQVSPGPGLPASGVLVLRGVNVSTSGDAEQFIEIGGVRYAHIVDPRTALGVTSRMAVTVIEEDPAACDALATAACVMEPAAVGVMLGRFPRAAAILQRIEAGEVRVTRLEPRQGRAPEWHPLPGR
jgi:thiamine biosynthesis lipoprotein